MVPPANAISWHVNFFVSSASLLEFTVRTTLSVGSRVQPVAPVLAARKQHGKQFPCDE